MASRYSIENIFRLIDKFTAPMSKITKSTKTFSSVVKRDFARAQRQVHNFARNFRRNLGRNILIGVGIASAAIGKLTVESTKAWDIQAAALKNVEAGIQSTGGVANRTLADLEKQAKSLQANTFIGDESILQGVTAQMLTFTNVTEERFDRAQKSIIDVTSKLYGLDATTENFRSTSIQVGKALNDPIANLGALGRMGIQFSKSMKMTIKDLVLSGRLTEAQSIILAEIEKQYGGTAAALAKTAGGMQRSAKNLTGDMLELIGKGIEPLRLKFLQFVNKILPKLLPYIQKFTDFIEQNADAIFQGFVNTMTVVWNVVKTGIKVLTTIYKILKPFAPIIFGIIAAFMIYKTVLMAAAVVQAIMNVIMLANPIGLIIIAIGILIGLVIIIVTHWKKIVAWLKKVWDAIVKVAGAIWNWLVKAFKGAIEWIKKVGQKFTFFLGPAGAIVSILIEITKQWDRITGKFKSGDILGGILAIGGAIVSGILAPVQGLLELLSKIPGVGDLAKGGAEKIAEFRSFLTGGEKEAPVSPAERSATIREERTSSGELVIRDETGKAQYKNVKGSPGYKIRLQPSGSFSGGAH